MNKQDREQLIEFGKKIDLLQTNQKNSYGELKKEFRDMKRDSLSQTIYTFIGISITYFSIAVTLILIPEKPSSLNVLTLATVVVGTYFTTRTILIYFDNMKFLNEKE
jgi:hypothetical protein